MKNSAYENFSEKALEALDFARCQRPDGSFYGTGGTCRKGSPTGAKEKEAPKGRKSSGKVSDTDAKKLSASLTKQIGDAAKAGDKKKVDNLMLAKDTVDRQIKAREKAKATTKPESSTKASVASDLKSKRAEVREMDKTAKAANKAADKADKKFQRSKSPADGKEARRLDKIAKSADSEANKADKELQRMAKSAKNDKGRAKNVKINEALASGNKSRLRSAQAEIQKRIAALEKKGQPVPKPLQATAKLLKSRIEG